MTLIRVTAVSMSLASALAGSLALPTHADAQRGIGGRGGGDRRNVEQVLFTWTGTVDRDLTLTMQGNDLIVSGERAILVSRGNRPRTANALPRRPGDVRLLVQDGRGSVSLIQQPSARNNYTLRIRIRDDRGGADRYRITAFWTSYDRNDRNDRDGRYDRDDRDDRDDRYDRNGRWEDDRDWGRGGRADRDFEGLRWSGVVDDVVDLRIRGKRVEVLERSGARTYDIRSTIIGNGLRANDGRVQLVQAAGRGRITVIQQPTRWNKYTAIVRVRDDRGGAGRYDLALRW